MVCGSWEGFAIESVVAASPEGTKASFYRTAAGTEIDLILELSGNRLWAIEIKRGWHQACLDVNPSRRFVVYGGTERCPVNAQTEAVGLADLTADLQGLG